jgi:hypothetical protein
LYVSYVLIQFLVACGGKVDSDTDGFSSGVGGASVTNTKSAAGGASAANGGSATTGGGTLSYGIGGASTTGGCSIAPVTFQMMPSTNSATVWCIGLPGGCWGRGSISDSSGTLQLETNCTASCDTCALGMCHPTLCWRPVELTAQGLSDMWDGTYFTTSTCGAVARKLGAHRLANILIPYTSFPIPIRIIPTDVLRARFPNQTYTFRSISSTQQVHPWLSVCLLDYRRTNARFESRATAIQSLGIARHFHTRKGSE